MTRIDTTSSESNAGSPPGEMPPNAPSNLAEARQPTNAAPGFFIALPAPREDPSEAYEMKRLAQELQGPYDGDDYRLVRGGRRRAFWHADDGRSVQVAASEIETHVERWRVSLLGFLGAVIAGGAARR